MPEVNNIFQLISSAQNILILVKGDVTISDLKHISSLCSVIALKEKTYQLFCLDKPKSTIVNYAKELGLNIVESIKPSEYIVSIDYASTGIEKVTYDTDKDSGKLIFKILPSKAGFSFDKVEFNEGSSKFDGTITIGLEDPSSLRDFYDEYEYLFRENQIYKLEKPSKIPSVLSENLSEISPQIASEILKNSIETVNLVEGTPDQEDLRQLFNFVDLGGDISQAIKLKYYSKPEDYLDLVKLVLNNVKSEGEIIYSYILKSDTKKFGLTNILNIGRLPFNYLAKYNLAMLFIEDEKGKAHMIVESNDVERFSAITIAGVFGGSGDAGHSTTKLDNMALSEINKRFSPILKDLYNIDLTLDFGVSSVDNLPEVLTKPRRNSKNKGLIKNK